MERESETKGEGAEPGEGAKKRRYGAGSIDELASGKFRVRVRLADGTRIAETASTREQAETIRRGLAGAIALERAEKPDELRVQTLRSFGQKFLDRRETSGLHRAIDTERGLWRAQVESAAFIDWPLAQITRRDVRAWLEALERKRPATPGREKQNAKARLSWSRRRQALVLLRVCLADAVERELVETNAAADLTVKKPAKSDEEWCFLTQAEVQTVMRSEKIPEPTRLLFTVAIHTGLRQGELWALRWRDVTLEGDSPQLAVHRSHRGPTKSGKARHVPLLETARAALEHWHTLTKHGAAGDLVFPSVRGHQRQRRADAGWSSRKVRGAPHVGYRELAGVNPKARFHDLRHTFASHLVQGTWGIRWSLPEIARVLGHASTAVTERYAHLAEEHLHRQARQTIGSQTPENWVTAPTLVEKQKADNPSGSPAFFVRRGDWIRTSDPQTPSPVASPTAARGYERPDPIVTQFSAALALLEGLEAGAKLGPLIDALVTSVLEGPAVKLALAAKEPGPFRVRRAIELAGLLLEASEGAATRGEGERSAG